MAKSSKSSKGFQIRRVKSREDRKRPSVFMSLKAEEAFKGVALFEPDPEKKDNPGYFEYFSHWDQEGNTYVPCAGEKCPFCAANDNPSTQALTVWYFPDAAEKKDQIKVFTMNYSTTQEASDESEDEGGILGKVVRIKRLNKKGDYRFKITSDKPLTKTELKKVMAMLEEKFPNGLVALVENQLKRQMERLKALEALDDDEDDDEDEDDEDDEPKSKRGKKASKDDDEEDDDEEDDDEEDDDEEDEDEEDEDDEDDDEESTPENIEDESFEILSVSKKNGFIVVDQDGQETKLYASDDTPVDDFKKGQTVTVSADYTEGDDEEEGYFLLTAIEEASDEEEDDEEDAEDADEDEDGDEDEDEDDDEDEIKGGAYEVVKTQEKDEILDLKSAEGEKVKMWVGDGVDVDFDEVKKGVQVKIDAEKDDEGDWIITKLAPVKSGKGKGGKKDGKKKK